MWNKLKLKEHIRFHSICIPYCTYQKLQHSLVNKVKGQTPMSPGKMFDAHRKVFSLEILMRNIKAQALTVQKFIRKVKVSDRITE